MASQDSHNLPSSHRLPTTSATEALTNLSSTAQKPISTGLRGLDSILHGKVSEFSVQREILGGISKGDVTEVSGPPGVGGSSFALNIAANALKAGDSVIWVDTIKSIHGSRLKDFLSLHDNSGTASSIDYDTEKVLDEIHYFTAPTLPHLLALLSHLTNAFPLPNTGLLVVDDLSALFSLSYRNASEKSNDQQMPVKNTQVAQWALSRRWVVMDHLISDLGKFAVTKNIAILLVNQMNTRIHEDARAVLCPAMTGTAWESGITTRIVLFRDWLFAPSENSNQRALQPAIRFAGVTKVQNISYEGTAKVTAFRFVKTGLEDIQLDVAAIKAHTSPEDRKVSLKRSYGEVADSESEEGGNAASDHDFGWDDDEATLEAESLAE